MEKKIEVMLEEELIKEAERLIVRGS